MKVVIDTNVMVAGLLSPFGPCSEILRLASAGLLEICFDACILAEYREVLGRSKFGFDQEKVSVFLDYIERYGYLTAPEPLKGSLPDKDDEVFLAASISSQAVCLITGNLAHFPENSRKGVVVLSPREFIEHYKK
ncbi:MAG: putative toxin-antitoxin system toxin component, PIN family [Desulfobacteraceae bacterium]|nr:MAG: putative toxin-antitoxin system toxin component, PIN family [Desulfobacteraceae bacterium]